MVSQIILHPKMRQMADVNYKKSFDSSS